MTFKALAGLAFCFVAATAGFAQEIGWPEAVGRLTRQRSKAETCIALVKKYGDEAQIARGSLEYNEAKSGNDGVISGLITALTLDDSPDSLPNLETQLQDSTIGLDGFCKSLSALIRETAGERGLLDGVIKEAIEPLLNSLSAAVGALYGNYREDDALIRKTIQTQLEAARWPDFEVVKAAD